jgi:hypothetical protein
MEKFTDRRPLLDNLRMQIDLLTYNEFSPPKFTGLVDFAYLPHFQNIIVVDHIVRFVCIENGVDNDYYKVAREYARTYPYWMKIWNGKNIREEKTKKEILDFIGYKPEEMVLNEV